MKDNLSNAPHWAHQGIATLFEKIYGYLDNGKLVLRYGFQNPWRIEALDREKGILDVKLDSIIHSSQANDVSASEKRLLIVFIFKHGKLKRYLELIRRNSKNGYNTFLEASFDKNLKTIKEIWAAYVTDIAQNKENIMKTPPSQLFPSKIIFEQKVGMFL